MAESSAEGLKQDSNKNILFRNKKSVLRVFPAFPFPRTFFFPFRSRRKGERVAAIGEGSESRTLVCVCVYLKEFPP